MGSKATFIKLFRGNILLLLPFSNSLEPETLFLIDMTVFTTQLFITKGFLGTKLSGGGKPEKLLLAYQ